MEMMLLAILICIICGLINGFLGKKLYEKNKEIDFWLSTLVILPLWIFSFIALFELWPYYIYLGYQNGMQFLWNFPFLGYTIPTVPSLYLYQLIIVIFAYPLIYFWCRERIFQIFGRKPWQGGALYLMTVDKPPKTAKKGEKIIKGPLIDFKDVKLENNDEEI